MKPRRTKIANTLSSMFYVLIRKLSKELTLYATQGNAEGRSGEKPDAKKDGAEFTNP
jgi:hypothetical protein